MMNSKRIKELLIGLDDDVTTLDDTDALSSKFVDPVYGELEDITMALIILQKNRQCEYFNLVELYSQMKLMYLPVSNFFFRKEALEFAQAHSGDVDPDDLANLLDSIYVCNRYQIIDEDLHNYLRGLAVSYARSVVATYYKELTQIRHDSDNE